MKPLAGKTALITGGGQGVGLGIATALAKDGAAVMLAGRTLEKCERAAEQLRGDGLRAGAILCDVKDDAHLRGAVDATIAEFGGLNILVNNAQEVPLGPLLKVSDEAFMGGLISGPVAVHKLMKYAHPHLKGGGHIINLLSSAMQRWDMRGYGAYGAVKSAMQQLTRAAACEWGVDGIRVNGIMPHAKSPALAGWMERNPKEAEAFQASIPLGRVGECEDDIGAFVALMCQDGSQYLTGQTIGLDGGQALI